MTTTLTPVYWTDAMRYHTRPDCPVLSPTPAIPVREATGSRALAVMTTRRPCPNCTP